MDNMDNPQSFQCIAPLWPWVVINCSSAKHPSKSVTPSSLLDLQEDAGLGEPEYVVRQGLQLSLGNAEHRVVSWVCCWKMRYQWNPYMNCTYGPYGSIWMFVMDALYHSQPFMNIQCVAVSKSEPHPHYPGSFHMTWGFLKLGHPPVTMLVSIRGGHDHWDLWWWYPGYPHYFGKLRIDQFYYQHVGNSDFICPFNDN